MVTGHPGGALQHPAPRPAARLAAGRGRRPGGQGGSARRLGVHHFTRKGVAKWNQPKGAAPRRRPSTATTTPGWTRTATTTTSSPRVDTDHVPLPNYLERMLGYFRDPDVAFVVGPQVYGNYDTAVTKAAESQQFLFHALIQRAGNRYGAPDVRRHQQRRARSARCKQIGGLYDSITEDMATGFEMHRPPQPRDRPQVALGLHPGRARRRRGAVLLDRLLHPAAARPRRRRLPPPPVLEGLLEAAPGHPAHLHPGGRPLPHDRPHLAAHRVHLRPLPAARSPETPFEPLVWLALHGTAVASRTALRLGNRGRNVSPHRHRGSSGIAGAAVSAVAARSTWPPS